MSTRPLGAVIDSEIFQANPVPSMVLDTDFVIRAVNTAYQDATGGRSDLTDAHVFEAFPDNPDEPESNGVEQLDRSLRRVLATGRRHNMIIQRYDIPAADNDGGWIEKHWSPMNSPLRRDGEAVGILHQVHDVTELETSARQALEQARDLLRRTQEDGEDLSESLARSVELFAAAAAHQGDLLREVTELRRALNSRSIIDMAKGLIIAELGCTPEEAFAELARLSSKTNIRVADLAARMVLGTPEESRET